MYLNGAEYEKAFEAFESLRARSKDHRLSQSSGAYLRYKTGDYEGAAVALKLQERGGRRGRRAIWRGRALVMLGKLDEAQSVFQALIEKWPRATGYQSAARVGELKAKDSGKRLRDGVFHLERFPMQRGLAHHA